MTISTKLAQEQGGPTKFEINPIDQGRILRPVTAPKRGRPSDYSPEIARTICYRLIEGESLRRICSDAGMPGKATVFRWIARHKEFRDRYIGARDSQAEGLGEEMFEILRYASGDNLALGKWTIMVSEILVANRKHPYSHPGAWKFHPYGIYQQVVCLDRASVRRVRSPWAL